MIGTAVIGGGLSGLARAWALQQRGEDVLLLEASSRVGGVVRTEQREGFLLELGPNTVRPTPEIWRLVGALGLEEDVLLSEPRSPRYIDFGGRLHLLPQSLPAMLRTRLLSARGKLRLLGEPLVSRGDGRESISEFFARRLGREFSERLMGPFVSGIFAGDAARLSATACFPTLARWEAERGSLLRGALAARNPTGGRKTPRGLLSFREGVDTFPKRIAGALGSRVRLDTPVRAIQPLSGSWAITASPETLSARRIVLAAPAPDAARLVAPFEPEASRALAEVPYASLAVLHLSWPESAFPRALHGFGHLVVPQPDRRILGAVWSSSLFPGRAPKGQTLLTVFIGGALDPDAVSFPDAELTAIATRDLSAALEVRGEPRLLAITRYPRALPQYDFDHARRLAAIQGAEARWPSLLYLGNYRGGVSVGDVVRNALV